MSVPKFAVFTRGSDNVLHHRCSGMSLGTGRRDVGFIVDGMTFDVMPGDVIELGDNFLMIDSIEPSEGWRDPSFIEYHYLEPLEDHDHMFGDGPWSLQMIARLRREALEGSP